MPGPEGAAAAEGPPGAREVAPGVLWLRMPLPFALDHINLWLLRDGDGWTLVDTGIGDDATRAEWERLSRTALQGRPVRRIICTHHHPDHLGLAGWLAARWGAEVWCTGTEWALASAALRSRPEDEEAEALAFYLRAGVPAREARRLAPQVHTYRHMVVPLPARYRAIRDGETVEVGGTAWTVVVGRGHAPEQACLHAPAAGILVAGDQVLPRISPNVAVWPLDPDADPLAEFLDTLEALGRLPGDPLVLPSHGAPFSGLRRRLGELALHHRDRLEAVLAACSRRRTAWQVTRALFPRELDAHQTTFALGESLAHLNHLVALGRVERGRPSGRAPDWYRRTAPAAPRR